MRDIARVLMSRGVQAQVRRSLQHAPGFQVEHALPEAIRLKLAELDRAVAETEAASAMRKAYPAA